MTRSTLPSIAAVSPIESDGGDGRRGIGADPGQRAQSCGFLGEIAAMPLDNGAGAGMQVAGARVIAEPLPELQDFVERGCGERPNIGPACHELVKIRADCSYCRLLQHDLAEPHAIRVGTAFRAARATAGCGGGGRTRRVGL